MLSVVIPVYNEEQIIPELYRRLKKVLSSILTDLKIDYEVIYVNDGSSDNTLLELCKIQSMDNKSIVIDLSRNHGHQIATTAGLKYAMGDFIIIMDSDLQDPPELIPELLKKAKDGFSVVYAVREKREGESFLKLWTAKYFYRIFNKLAGINIPLDTGDFRLITKDVLDYLNQMNEQHRFLRGLTTLVGFKQTGIYYKRDMRYAGETKFSYLKMFRFAFDGITSFSYLPLQMATAIGFLILIFSFVFIILIGVLKILNYFCIKDIYFLFVALFFLGGVQLVFIGLLGEYIGRIYLEVKGRPLYFIRKIYRKNFEKT